MDIERKRVATNPSRNGVVVGSVWESRMRGSFKVFNANANNQQSDKQTEQNQQVDESVKMEKSVLRSKHDGINSKRKTWKSDTRSSDANGIKKSGLAEIKKGRQEWNNKTRPIARKSSASNELVLASNESNIEINAESRDDDEMKKDDVCDDKLMTVEVDKVEGEEECNEEVNDERAIVVVKEMEPVSNVDKKKLPEAVVEEKKVYQRNERSSPISRTIRKQVPPVVNHPRTVRKSNELPSQRVPRSHNKLQNFIDLIMWTNASKSALLFGFGTFSIISSSYTQDLNISFISVIAYMGLIYLAVIFIFKSYLFRGGVREGNSVDDDEYVIGEDEAIWALKVFLPFINEFLIKVKALFSGDPATTMKLAVLLFILARCGSSITIWKMTKLGFFVVFTVPKICSSYSSQLNSYGTFWIQRFRDAWESCSQKKAIAFGIFTLVWNLSSIVARIWAVFMLLVAFKYYQQSMMKEEVRDEEEEKEEDAEVEEPITRRRQSSWQEQRNGRIYTTNGNTKLKKSS